jgi:hypothetical protein
VRFGSAFTGKVISSGEKDDSLKMHQRLVHFFLRELPRKFFNRKGGCA